MTSASPPPPASPTTPQWLTDGLAHMWLPYTQVKTAPMPIPVAATRGSKLILEDGRELVDGCSSWWTAAHGYNHPHLMEAIRAQLEKIPHVMMGGLANEPAYTLAKRLADLLPGDLSRVFFADSGSVSVEVAMKMAIQYWINKGETGHKKFACFEHGYHGDTMGAMSVCDVDRGMHQVFKGAIAEQHLLKMPSTEEARADFRSFLAAHRDELAAVIMEPLVQGAGGLKFHDEETLQFIRAETEKADVLLIFDEIMTGFGRLGAMFACTAARVVPDIITLSKALTGGTMPLSAAVSNEKVSRAFISDKASDALMHGPTYMGFALGCAAANASLDLFAREPRLDQVRAIEEAFLQSLPQLRGLPGIVDVRVRGAIGVIQVAELRQLDWLKSAFMEHGVFVRPMADVIYAAPPFILTTEETALLTGALVEVTKEWSARAF